MGPALHSAGAVRAQRTAPTPSCFSEKDRDDLSFKLIVRGEDLFLAPRGRKPQDRYFRPNWKLMVLPSFRTIWNP